MAKTIRSLESRLDKIQDRLGPKDDSDNEAEREKLIAKLKADIAHMRWASETSARGRSTNQEFALNNSEEAEASMRRLEEICHQIAQLVEESANWRTDK